MPKPKKRDDDKPKKVDLEEETVGVSDPMLSEFEEPDPED